MFAGAPQLQIDVRGSQVLLKGDLDMETSSSLVEAAQRVLAGGHRDPVVDCSAVAFCDSYGLRALTRVAELVEPEGSVSIVGASPTLLRILQIAGLAGSFTLVGDAAQAGTARR